MLNQLKRFFKEEKGAAGLEYTLLLLVVVIVLTLFYDPIRDKATEIWSTLNSAFQGATPLNP